MADTNSYKKHKLLKTEENRAYTSKFHTSFLCKALIVSICLVIFPLFPSQAPEFINQTLLTRSWELLHLVFVGIAVSYGLFSHRNDEIEKDNNTHSKFDNAQTYVSRFLQVSSVFDDENETLSGSDENKVQTWINQYYRNEPAVVVAKEHSVFDQEHRETSSTIGEKPLLLPIRSLKPRVPDADTVEPSRESKSLSRSSSNSGSRRFSSNSNKRKNGELGGYAYLDEKLTENAVLPSPIPWRSRSGRMEMKEGVDNPVPALNSRSPSTEEHEFTRLETRSSRPQMPRSSRPNSTSSSPKLSSSPSISSPSRLSPSPSLSLESQAKNSEDFVKKKSFYRPPPPPPPPPQVMQKSASMRASSSLNKNETSFEKNLKRSFTAETKEFNMGRVNSGVEIKAKDNLDGLSMGKSVRTMRSVDMGIKDKEIENGVNAKAERRAVIDQSSFKTQQPRRESVNFMPNPTYMEFPKQDKEEFVDKVVVETDEDSESEDDYYDDNGETPFVSNARKSSNNEEETASSIASDGGPDVDKKADEFIAKFREQIRLQRIDSIKRSSAQIRRNSSR